MVVFHGEVGKKQPINLVYIKFQDMSIKLIQLLIF